MGTHPIFESDFDCLTELKMMRLRPQVFRFLRSINVATGVVGYSKESYSKYGILYLSSEETQMVGGASGEDAFFINKTDSDIDTYGIADGVGGWRRQGIDPSIFSTSLMEQCMNISATNPDPKKTLINAVSEMQKIHKSQNYRLLGSSTAVCISIDKKSNSLSVANLGDSGFLVLREGKVLLRSKEQVHRFNCPFQISLFTPGYNSISDSAADADEYNFELMLGDVVVTGSDGLFDNCSDELISDILSDINHENFRSKLDDLCGTSLAVALDPEFMSPFALEARRQGYKDEKGGKLDDFTVIVNLIV